MARRRGRRRHRGR